MEKANVSDVIEWRDKKEKKVLVGTVRKVLTNSVIVDISGTYDATVVSHKRYKILKKGTGETAAPIKKFRYGRDYPQKVRT